MSKDDNSKKKRVKILSFALLFVIAGILITIVITLLTGNCSGSASQRNMRSRRVPNVTVEEFDFDTGRNKMFAAVPGFIASAGTLGIQVFDSAGNETLRDSFRMSQPVITDFGSGFIAYDSGGSEIRVFNNNRIISSFDTDGIIVSASGNQNGWFCVVTQKGGGIRGTVSVYNNNGTNVFNVDMRTGFVLSAELSPDNKSLAILNLTDSGSRVTFYADITAEDEQDRFFDLPDGLIIDIKYLSTGDVLAVSTDLLFLVDDSGDGKALYPFPDKRLGNYSNDDTFIALHLYDYGIGSQGRLVTLLSDGTVLGELSVDREIISMSVFDNTLVVLKNDGVVFYNNELTEFKSSASYISTAGSSQVLTIRNDTALVTSDSSAVIFRREEER